MMGGKWGGRTAGARRVQKGRWQGEPPGRVPRRLDYVWQVLGEEKEQGGRKGGGRTGGREGDEDVLSSSSWREGARL